MASRATAMVRETSTVSEPVTNSGSVNRAENEIARVAYQLWLDCGRPIGSDLEHWFRAEEMLRTALLEKCEDRSSPPAICRSDVRAETGIVAEFTVERWEGHWEAWEREWGDARWIEVFAKSRPID